MTVYVDDFRAEARVGGLHSRWSHMIADTPEELHEFARRIGLKPEWFQDPCVNGKPRAEPGTRLAENWHYDVTDSKRRQALSIGAKPISWRRLHEVIDARWQAKQEISEESRPAELRAKAVAEQVLAQPVPPELLDVRGLEPENLKVVADEMSQP
jgi:hypothetical protein